MGYCSVSDVDRILAQALTSATNPESQSKRNLLKIGNVRDKNNIPDSIVNQYIQWSGQEIDAILSEMYKTPVCEVADFEGRMEADISEYNSYIVLEENCPLMTGDKVVVSDGNVEEVHEIDEIIGGGIFSTVNPIDYPFENNTRIIRVKFPDPLPFICVRLAAANIFDKYYSAQVSPNISDYGNYLRNQARQKINDILNGRTILWGVQRVGRRFFNPNLVDQYNLPLGQEPQRDIDDLS